MKTPLPLVLAVILLLSPSAFAQRGVGRAGAPGGVPRTPGGAPRANPNQPANQSPASSGNSSGNSPANSGSSGQNDSGSQSDMQNAQSNNVWSVADKILNSDSLSADTENGVFSWNNSKFDIGNNLLVRSRFERYLSSPGYPDTELTYQQTLKQIEDLLTNNPADGVTLTAAQKDDRVFQAWQMLAQAAKYSEDGGASETLANQVYNAWRVRDELTNNRADYEKLQGKEKSQRATVSQDSEDAILAIQQANYENGFSGTEAIIATQGGTMTTGTNGPTVTIKGPASTAGNGSSSSSSSGNTSGSGSSGSSSGDTSGSGSSGGGSNGNSLGLTSNGLNISSSGMPSSGGSSNSGTNSTQPTGKGMGQNVFHAADLAKTYAMENLLDADATTMGLQAKLQYQTQMVAYISQRRFQHSLIAGQFYEHLFKGSQQRVNIAQDEISRLINSDNVVPSVNNFEFISHEAIADVDTSMKAVETAYDAGDRWTALQQLQQTFLLGEMLPPVQQFDAAKRKVLLGIYRDSNDLRHMMEVHDFAGSEDTLKKLQAEAPDFEAAPVVSAIKEGEQTSNNYVLAASQAALLGDSDRVTDNLQKAGEMWPLNPKIAEFSNNLLDRTNVAKVGGKKFDELLAKGDDRAIYDDRDEIGLAVYQDPEAAAKLKEVLNRMGQVEMAVAFADQAMKQNNGYAAWETLQSAADIEPNDPVLARTMLQVEPSVANFVSALNAADRAAKSGNYASALNYYLQAQDIYPLSTICHDAIPDLSAKLMAKLNPSGPTAKSLANKNSADSPPVNPPAQSDASAPKS